MKNLLYGLMLLFGTAFISHAQNLVRNPSFEQTNSCDFNYFISMDTSANLLPNQYPDVLYWLRANQTPIRYGNRCYNALHPGNLGGGVPMSEVGYQEPRTGDAYFKAGIYENTPVYPNGEDRAYLQTKLIDTLKQGHLYCGEMYVNQSYNYGDDYNIVTTDAMSMALTKYRPFNKSLALYQDDTAKTAIYLEPSIINRGFFPNDTLTWQRIHGIYKAKGGEKWLTLGNFYNRDTTAIQIIRPFTDILVQDSKWAWFFIDDVSLHEISAPLFSSRDTVVCNFPMQITTRSGFDTYLWSTGATTQTATLSQAGTYWVRVSSECGTATDTIIVRSVVTQTTSHHDTTLCLPALLSANAAGGFLWNTNETTQHININTAGIYWVWRQISPCIIAIDTFIVKGIDIQTTSHRDTTACLPMLLTAYTANTYNWNTTETTQNINITAAGTYYVKRNIAMCSTKTDTIHVHENLPPLPLHFADTTLCSLDLPIRYTVPDAFSNIKWSDNTIDNPKNIIKSGTYTVAADWECGTLRDTFTVKTETPLPPIHLLTQDTTSCTKGHFVAFRLRAPYGYPNYVWRIGDLETTLAVAQNYTNHHTILVEKAGIYAVSSENICGAVSDKITVTGCPPNYFIPNTFTPNGDGHNDVFTVFASDAIVNIKSMQIFDRWGEAVFSAQNLLPSVGLSGLGWDGTFKNQAAAQDVYVYIITLAFADGTTETVKGDVTLLR